MLSTQDQDHEVDFKKISKGTGMVDGISFKKMLICHI